MPGSARLYHHGDLRAALIAAGLELTRAGGPDALVLREVTRRAGVSPTAAYRHFADRAQLLEAVSDAVLDRVAAAMHPAPRPGSVSAFNGEERAPSPSDAAVARLAAVGLGYIGFARAEPGWFATAFFGRRATPRSVQDAAPFRALSGALDAMDAAGLVDARRRDGAEWACWSMVHGFADLALHGPLRFAQPTAVDALAERVVDAVIAGLCSSAPAPPDAAPEPAGALSDHRRRGDHGEPAQES